MYRFSVVLLSILQVGAVTFLPKREYNISLQVKTTNGIVQGRKMATENESAATRGMEASSRCNKGRRVLHGSPN
ncbi:unnamed protein product [Acanthoscelides obtectus]|uniref:Secreted protein n=1 Tax=Acanthoscelides obtectus TaxID=200917 RepID=A0A9P0JNU2_ACAOB|nr:unnamed protein product [Acanthoscelides obtectus]CAK1678478.1 hypothetical protein AOBTE_LOCUS31926 [Acanthoscelides obtectus]